MEALRVTLIQTPQIWEDKHANLSLFDTHFAQINTPTDLVLLPEMFHTGFSMKAKELADDFENSIAISWLKGKAKSFQTAIYTSFICKEKEQYFNRGIFVFPSGEYELYDKRKLFSLAKEEEFYTAGKEEKIIHYKGFKLFLSICFDLRFPEIQRNSSISTTEAKYDVLLNVANWPEKRSLHWKALGLARAIENQCFFVGVNRVGIDKNDLHYSGDSAVYDPLGNVLTAILPSDTQIETVVLKKSTLLAVRENLNFLKDI